MSFSNNNKVNDFLEKLSQQCPKQRDESKIRARQIEKVYLNFKGNFGRYQILPMDSVITDYPFVTLFNTYEVNVKRRSKAADGTETVHDAWLRLLPPDTGYLMKDMTGRVVSSLTATDLELLNQTRALFDELWEEVEGRTNRDEAITKLIRKRNYTIWFAQTLNHWGSDSRTPTRQNFPALFVCTAKNFVKAVMDNINDKSLMNEGDVNWLGNIYNRNLTGRDGFLMFSIAGDLARPGYVVTANHEWGRAKQLEGVAIPEEDAELMADPVEAFLGWQAPRNDENVPPQNRRLFNPTVYKEAQAFLAELLANIRMAKSMGTDIAEAIEATTMKALANQPVNQMAPTNDPVLAGTVGVGVEATYSSPNVGGNLETIAANNTSPFTSAPSGQFDPISGMPVNNEAPQNSNPFGSGSGFSRPSFGGAPFGGN